MSNRKMDKSSTHANSELIRILSEIPKDIENLNPGEYQKLIDQIYKAFINDHPNFESS
jgi:hypothetical protein